MVKNKNQVKSDRVETSSNDVLYKETVGKSVNLKHSKFLCLYWSILKIKFFFCSEQYNFHIYVFGQTLIYRVFIRTMGEKLF